jgi:2,3-bisphosphoglycerate-independent phosphoglycerate mutase
MTLLFHHTPKKEELSKKAPGRPKVALVILDGWGNGSRDGSNPIYVAQPKNIESVKRNFAITNLQASGLAIGLPWEEEGNSEIGHLTIGAGRIAFQDYPRISSTIRDGSFFRNAVLLDLIDYAKENRVKLNLVGLIGEGNVHSSFEHLRALLRLFQENQFDNFSLQVITDGRDGPTQAGLNLIKQLPLDKIGSISGRFYAMDRDEHLDRTALAFQAMTGAGPQSADPIDLLEKSYGQGQGDEFIKPTTVSPDRTIKEKEAVLFFNFREERMRQLVQMFLEKMPGLKMTSFTGYGHAFSSLAVAFPRPHLDHTLGQVISEAGLSQLRVAESEKGAHVTYFFNDEREDPFPNEYRTIIPSRKVANPAKFPEMMAPEITNRLVSAMEEGIFSFILANYANPDIIGHTGDFDATLRAIEVIDQQVGQLVEAALKNEVILLISSDHGNAERLIDLTTGLPETRHNASPVPFYVVAKNFRRPKDDWQLAAAERDVSGSLCDIAPTVLKLIGLDQPPEMTGQNLLPFLK